MYLPPTLSHTRRVLSDVSRCDTTDKCGHQSSSSMRQRWQTTCDPSCLGLANTMTNLFRKGPASPSSACHMLPKVLRLFNVLPRAVEIHAGHGHDAVSSVLCIEDSRCENRFACRTRRWDVRCVRNSLNSESSGVDVLSKG